MGERWIRPAALIVALELAFACIVGQMTGYRVWPPVSEYLFVFSKLVAIGVPIFILWHILALKWTPNPTRQLFDNFKASRDLLVPVIIGIALVMLQKMALTWLKPTLMSTGFWADPILAHAEKAILGADAWRIAHDLIGSNNRVVDVIYALWFPAILVAFFFVFTSRSAQKSRVIIAYFLTVLIGITLQFALPSGGPIFYARLGFGDHYAELMPLIPYQAFGTSRYLFWHHLGMPGGIAIGISAWPSIHCALASWAVIAAWALKPRLLPIVVAWWAAILFGSVYLGWHYLLDGVAGALIAVLAWAVQGKRFALPAMRLRPAQ